MRSGYPDGRQEGFVICQTTINSWQAQDQLSVSKYHLGQIHLKISVLVPPSWQGQLQLRLESESQKQSWSCRALLETLSQASKIMSLLHLVRIKAQRQ